MLETSFRTAELGELLEKVVNNLQTQNLLREMEQTISLSSRQAFARQRDPRTNQAWPGLESGLSRSGGAGRMLYQTGALQDSLFIRWENNSLHIGYSSPYAAMHQFGTRYIPARPFLGLTPQTWQELKNNLARNMGVARLDQA